jgi:large subunit ribosomal protein L15
MQLHQLKLLHKPKKRKRVGRGGKRGTYSGRGQKGQKARSGRRLKPVIRELIKRYPKLRGYKSKVKSQKSKVVILNLEILEKKFSSGDKINPQVLIGRKIISKIKGRVPRVKILTKGEITKTLIIEDCLISKGAKEKIEKAGGQIKTKNQKLKFKNTN